MLTFDRILERKKRMKTVDIIPLILYELEDGDKYGLEIIKNIQDKTNDQIEIKQPALYNVLKKLEKSRFISSYWQDSEIGGKRHYYKITEAGKLQLSTLPSYSDLINKISDNEPENNPVKASTLVESIPADLPTSSRETADNIDQKTNTQLNIENLAIFNDSPSPSDDSSKFTEKMPTQSKFTNYKTELNDMYKKVTVKPAEIKVKYTEDSPATQLSINDKLNNIIKSQQKSKETTQNELKTVFTNIEAYDYKDFNTDKTFQTSYNVVKQKFTKTLIFTLILLAQVIIFFVIKSKFDSTPIYVITMVLLCLVTFAYPALFMYFLPELKSKLFQNKYTYDPKKDFLIRLVITIALIALICILNFTGVARVGANVFKLANFGNFCLPILATLDILIEYAVGRMIVINNKD